MLHQPFSTVSRFDTLPLKYVLNSSLLAMKGFKRSNYTPFGQPKVSVTVLLPKAPKVVGFVRQKLLTIKSMYFSVKQTSVCVYFEGLGMAIGV